MFAAVGLVACALVSPGCASESLVRPEGHRGHDGTSAAHELHVVADDYRFTSDHATVAPGVARIQLDNQGTEAHQMQVGRTDGRLTPEQFVDLFHHSGDLASVRALRWVGGVGVIEPGDQGEAEVELRPGDYLLVCYVPSPDGTSHVMKGMVTRLHVAGASGPTSEAQPSAAQSTVRLRDYAIELPAGFRGRGEVRFTNVGHEPHEVVFMKLKRGRTLADVIAYGQDHHRDVPFTFAAGVGSVAPGTSATAELALTPGQYLATCFVPGPSGQQHVAMGMVTPFTIR
jgi:plastocyanin